MTARRKLPKKRRAHHQNAVVGGTSTILTIGRFDDGTIGEVFFDLDMHREGAPLRTILNALARSVSLGLQHGAPVDGYVKLFSDVRCEPAGDVTGHPSITSATSLLDYLAKALDAAKVP